MSMFRQYNDINRPPASSSKSKNARSTAGQWILCDICDDGWQSETDTVLHREVHFKEIKGWARAGKHVCLICAKLLQSKSHLTRHIKTAHLLSSPKAIRVEKQIYVCNDCPRIFFEKTLLLIHIYKTHLQCKTLARIKLPCLQCSNHYPLSILHRHMTQTHNNMSVVTCRICCLKCANSSDLENHVSRDHPSYFHCDQCSLTFKDGAAFKNHIERHDNESSRFKIPLDLKDSPTKKEKREQLNRWYHPKMKYYRGTKLEGHLSICILCRHICSSRRERKKHVASHFTVLKSEEQTIKANKESNINICTCGQTFSSFILKKHHLFTHKDHKMADVKVEVAEVAETPKLDCKTEPNTEEVSVEEIVPNMDDVLERIFI